MLGRTKAEFSAAVCENCGRPPSEHEKERVYPDDGPAGSYHYEYYCK